MRPNVNFLKTWRTKFAKKSKRTKIVHFSEYVSKIALNKIGKLKLHIL
jgi:hypothetical protein